jgi:exopolysaccharide biosynthesis protein
MQVQTGQSNPGNRKSRRTKQRRKLINKLSSFVIYFMAIVFVVLAGAGGAALLVIRSGLTPDIQEYLVTTSMTTLNHKYIARIVASPAKIREIMSQNKVVETYTPQDSTLIVPQKITAPSSQATAAVSAPKLLDISKDGYKAYLLEIPDASKVFLGISSLLGTRGEKISTLTKANEAYGGINASGFVDSGGKGMGAKPTGLIIKNGKILYQDNTVKKYSVVGFNNSNILVVGKYTSNQLPSLGLRDAVDFHPFLIINNEPTIVLGNGGWGSGPRTAIGQRADGTVLMVVIDGRQLSSRGASMKQLQQIMLEHGAVNAANLDGGSSTVLYFQDKIVNSPCSPYGDRYLPDAFLVKQ